MFGNPDLAGPGLLPLLSGSEGGELWRQSNFRSNRSIIMEEHFDPVDEGAGGFIRFGRDAPVALGVRI